MQGSHVRRARLAGRLSLVGAVVFVLAALATSPVSRADAAPSGTLAMSPGNSSINVNDTLGITLDVVGGANVHRVLLTVTYNPVVVSVLDANSGAGGTQILPGAFPGTTGQGSVQQNSAGVGAITYEFTLNGSAEASGSGTVATVQFLALAVGNANLQWSTVELTDAAGADSTPSGNAAVLMVGQSVATSTPQPTGTPTNTPTPTDTPSATDTPAPGSTDTPTATGTVTISPTLAPSITPSPAPGTPTVTPTKTIVATSTPRITVIEDTNKGKPPQGGVDPSQSDRANGLPSAGNDAPGVKWWRWVFFAAALMLAGAGWFFTFALHYGDKEPILIDKGFDRRRRRKW